MCSSDLGNASASANATLATPAASSAPPVISSVAASSITQSSAVITWTTDVPADSQVIIALDCDALDPSIVPGVIGRAPGGLTYWQVVELIHGIAGKATIAAFDVVEYMPDVDVDSIGALNNARIICNVLGLVSRQANW